MSIINIGVSLNIVGAVIQLKSKTYNPNCRHASVKHRTHDSNLKVFVCNGTESISTVSSIGHGILRLCDCTHSESCLNSIRVLGKLLNITNVFPLCDRDKIIPGLGLEVYYSCLVS